MVFEVKVVTKVATFLSEIATNPERSFGSRGIPLKTARNPLNPSTLRVCKGLQKLDPSGTVRQVVAVDALTRNLEPGRRAPKTFQKRRTSTYSTNAGPSRYSREFHAIHQAHEAETR